MKKYKITELREKNNMTQTELAEKCDVTQTTVSRWESIETSDETAISSSYLSSLCIALDCSLTELVESRKTFLEDAKSTGHEASKNLTSDEKKARIKEKLIGALKQNDHDRFCETVLLVQLETNTSNYEWFNVLIDKGLNESRDLAYTFISAL